MNKKTIRQLIFFILIILWAGIIFFMSSMDTYESNGKSKNIISVMVEKTVEITNHLEIINKHLSQDETKKIIEKINKPLRKVAHVSEYFILTLFIIFALTNIGIKEKKTFIIALLICFIYACTDEYHQTFVKGRTGQFIDTLIDTMGGVSSCIFYYAVKKYISKKRNVPKANNS